MEQPGLQAVSLFVIEGDEREVLLSPVLDERPIFLIGSDSRAALRLDDPAVAVSHAAVSRRGDVYHIEPRYPKLDVWVNGKRIIAPTPLKSGDRIQIGSTTLRFEQEQRRVQAAVFKPTASQPALPVKSPVSPSSLGFVPSQTVAVSLPPGGEIYRPKPRQDVSRGGGLILLGFLAVLGVLVFGAYSLISAASASGVPARSATDAYNDGNIAVLVFGQIGCVPCETQKSILNSLAREFRGDVYFHNYSLNIQANLPFVEEYDIMYLPTMVVLDDKGEMFANFQGVTDPDELRAAFEGALQLSGNN